MKILPNKITIGLILLNMIFVVSALSQNDISAFPNLRTKVISIENSKLNVAANKYKRDSVDPAFELNFEKALKSINGLLTNKGSIKFSKTNRFLVVMDTSNRIKLIERFIRIIDQSKLDFSSLFSGKEDQDNVYSVRIPFQNLSLAISCGSGREKIPWQRQHGQLLFSTIKFFRSRKSDIEFLSREKVIIKDGWDRVVLIKEIIELLDKPIIE